MPDGTVRYEDREEQGLADGLRAWRHVHLHTLDLILEAGDDVWRTLDQRLLRDELREMRSAALDCFKAGDTRTGVLYAYACWVDLSSEWAGEELRELVEARRRRTRTLMPGRAAGKPTYAQIRAKRATLRSDQQAANALKVSLRTVQRAMGQVRPKKPKK